MHNWIYTTTFVLCTAMCVSSSIVYTSENLKEIARVSGPRSLKLPPDIYQHVKQLGVLKPTHRGKSKCDYEPRHIPVIIRERTLSSTKRTLTEVNPCNLNCASCHHDNLATLNKTDSTSTKSQTIRCSTVNTQSIRNKHYDFLHHISTEEIDVCLVTETWLQNKDRNIMAALKEGDYSFISSPRLNTTTFGGGIGLLHNKLLKASHKSSFEAAEFSVLAGNTPLQIIGIYRLQYSPSHPVSCNTFIEEFSDFLEQALPIYDNPIIMGDFNIHVNKIDDPNALAFQELLTSFSLHQYVNIPTHVSGNTLDLVITKSTSMLNISTPSSSYFISDHTFVDFSINIVRATVTKKTITYRNIKGIDKDEIKNDLREANNKIMEHPLSVDLPAMFNHLMTDIMNHHAPLITKRITLRKQHPWYDDEAKILKSEKRKLERRWKNTKNSIDRDNFQLAKLIYRDHLFQSRQQFVNDAIQVCGRNTKQLYSTVFGLLDMKKTNPLPDGIEDEILSEEFADFFLNKITTIRQSLDQYASYTPSAMQRSSFDGFLPVSEEDVRKIIVKSPSATAVNDSIPTEILKTNLDVLLPAITRIINSSLQFGSFDSSWKLAVVKPLLKKTGLLLTKNNYRPVSNLPFISKVAEKVVLSQFIPFLDANNIIPTYQSAYRQAHSTETSLISLMDDLLWAMERGQVTSLVAMDLSAAFDTVDHSILLAILEKTVGVSGVALNWFRSYLSDRKMSVQINNCLSAPRHLEFSVPQGSVAGPVLFNIYTSSLQEVVDPVCGKLGGYADDHILHKNFAPMPSCEAQTVERQEDCLIQIKNWMDSNRLRMNPDKTEFIYFGSSHQLSKCTAHSIDVDGVSVNKADSIKLLGATLDENLNLKKHISLKCSVASRNIHMIKSLRKYLSTTNCNQLMYSMVLSHMDYANGIFAGLPKCTLDRLQRIQNWAGKVTLSRSRQDSSSDTLRTLHWLPVHKRVKFKVLTLTHRAIHGAAPAYINSLITRRQFPRNTRLATEASESVILDPPITKRKTFADRAFSVFAPKEWNLLPVDLRNIEDYEQFRGHLKTYLFRD